MPGLTVRMTEPQIARLRKQAELEGRSMNDVAVLAINARTDRTARVEADREAIARGIVENGPLLDLLAQ